MERQPESIKKRGRPSTVDPEKLRIDWKENLERSFLDILEGKYRLSMRCFAAAKGLSLRQARRILNADKSSSQLDLSVGMGVDVNHADLILSVAPLTVDPEDTQRYHEAEVAQEECLKKLLNSEAKSDFAHAI